MARGKGGRTVPDTCSATNWRLNQALGVSLGLVGVLGAIGVFAAVIAGEGNFPGRERDEAEVKHI